MSKYIAVKINRSSFNSIPSLILSTSKAIGCCKAIYKQSFNVYEKYHTWLSFRPCSAIGLGKGNLSDVEYMSLLQESSVSLWQAQLLVERLRAYSPCWKGARRSKDPGAMTSMSVYRVCLAWTGQQQSYLPLKGKFNVSLTMSCAVTKIPSRVFSPIPVRSLRLSGYYIHVEQITSFNKRHHKERLPLFIRSFLLMFNRYLY